MVGDPNQIAQTVERLISGAGAGNADMELRAKVGRLNFSAGRYADRSNCNCQGCALLRQANDLLAPESVQKGQPDAQSLSPSA